MCSVSGRMSISRSSDLILFPPLLSTPKNLNNFDKFIIAYAEFARTSSTIPFKTWKADKILGLIFVSEKKKRIIKHKYSFLFIKQSIKIIITCRIMLVNIKQKQEEVYL